MTEHQAHPAVADAGGLLTGYRWVASLFALLVIAQAFFGTRGYFGQPDLVTVHEMLANAMFLLAIAQVVLAWLLNSRSTASMRDVALNGVLVALTVAQIGLGYSTRGADSFATTISLHIPNGVLLMGVSTIVAVMAWQIDARAEASRS